MTILVDQINLLFTGIPGTASTSLEAALEKIPSARWIGPKHATVASLVESQVLSSSDAEGLTIFCVVRNPYDMIHAEWHRSKKRWVLEMDDPDSVGSWPAEKRRQIMLSAAYDFSDFVSLYYGHAYYNNKEIRLYNEYTSCSSMVFNFEQLDDIKLWLKNTHDIDIDLPFINKTDNRNPYWRDYDMLARDIISNVFRKDIEDFGYKF